MRKSKLSEEQFRAQLRPGLSLSGSAMDRLMPVSALWRPRTLLQQSQINGLIETAAAPRGQTVTQPVGSQPGYVAPSPWTLVASGPCEDYCCRVADNLRLLVRPKCRQ